MLNQQYLHDWYLSIQIFFSNFYIHNQFIKLKDIEKLNNSEKNKMLSHNSYNS